MRHRFQEQMRNMRHQIVRMGQLVVEAIEGAALALARSDQKLARQVIAMDDEVDRLQIEIQMQALQLMALQQPMARDLRVLGTSIKLVTDLERMADHATDIAKIALKLEGKPRRLTMSELSELVALAQEITLDALQAYVTEDEAAARRMIEKDHQLDGLYRRVFDQLVNSMQADPSLVPEATAMLHVAMFLERIGDHATNLGEWTIYLLTGQLEELNV